MFLQWYKGTFSFAMRFKVFFNIWRNILLIDDVEVFKFVGVFLENRKMLFIDRQSVTMSVP